MKIILLAISYLWLLMSSTCDKEGQDCNEAICIKNKSNTGIVVAISIKNGIGQCILDGQKVESGSVYNYFPFKSCIQKSLGSSEYIDLYIVDTNNFNIPILFYACDSIETNYKVLKKHSLSLEDLKKSNFIITYP